MFKILQKFLPEIINLLLTFYLQAQQLTSQRFPLGSPKVYRVPMPEPAVKQSGTEISYFFLKMTY